VGSVRCCTFPQVREVREHFAWSLDGGWIGKNCYQNCYRCAGVALEVSSLAAVRPWARQLLR